MASSDWSEHAPWQQMEEPSLLLLDARDQSEIQALLSSPRTSPFVYRIAFRGAVAEGNSEPLMDAGIDDSICFPINTGELLTRLKSGLRRLEFERRFALAKILDQQTGIATRTGFVRQLERQMNNESETKDGALVVIGIDFFDLIYSKHGYFAAEEASTLLAQCLSDQLSEEDFCGVLDQGVFAVLLHDSTVNEGVQFAEIVAKEIDAQDTSISNNKNRLSVSGVVINWPCGASAGDVVERGLAVLTHVKCFGGGLILDANKVEQDFSTWQQQHDVESPSPAVFARHVMEALPLVLPIDGFTLTHEHSLGIYALTPDQTLPPCIPVVDEHGVLLGVLEQNSLRQLGNAVFQALDEHLIPAPATVQANLPFDELCSTMEMVKENYLIVVENKRPIGYITSENLAALTVDPIEEQANTQRAQNEVDLSSLVVSLN